MDDDRPVIAVDALDLAALLRFRVWYGRVVLLVSCAWFPHDVGKRVEVGIQRLLAFVHGILVGRFVFEERLTCLLIGLSSPLLLWTKLRCCASKHAFVTRSSSEHSSCFRSVHYVTKLHGRMRLH